MSLESVLDGKFQEVVRAMAALREIVKDTEKRVRELPNEILALQKKRQVAEEEAKVAVASAEKRVAQIYTAAAEVERKSGGMLTQIAEERKMLEIDKVKTSVLQKSLDQQKAACDRLLKELEDKQGRVDGKLQKLEVLKTL